MKCILDAYTRLYVFHCLNNTKRLLLLRLTFVNRYSWWKIEKKASDEDAALFRRVFEMILAIPYWITVCSSRTLFTERGGISNAVRIRLENIWALNQCRWTNSVSVGVHKQQRHGLYRKFINTLKGGGIYYTTPNSNNDSHKNLLIKFCFWNFGPKKM